MILRRVNIEARNRRCRCHASSSLVSKLLPRARRSSRYPGACLRYRSGRLRISLASWGEETLYKVTRHPGGPATIRASPPTSRAAREIVPR